MSDKYERSLAKLNAPVSDRYGTRAQRRAAVVALYGGYLLACAALWFAGASAQDSTAHAAALAIASIGLLCTIIGFRFLMRRTFVNAAQVRDEALDERQRETRNRTMRSAYIVLSLVIALQTVLLMLPGSLGLHLLSPFSENALVAYGLGVSLLAITLPTVMLAWITPDPPVERE